MSAPVICRCCSHPIRVAAAGNENICSECEDWPPGATEPVRGGATWLAFRNSPTLSAKDKAWVDEAWEKYRDAYPKIKTE